MNVAVVVPTKDSARTLRPCLESIQAQTLSPEHVLVVDNHSSDATPAIASDLGTTLLIAGPERCAQRNAGWRAVASDAVAFIDSDMVLEPAVLEQAVAVLSSDEAVGAVVIPEVSFGEGFFAGCRALEKSLYVGDPRVEAARVFRREALEQVGGYDESLTAGEDWDLADRVAAAGWKTARTTAVVRHDEGRVTLRTVFNKKRYYGQTLAAYYSRTSHRGATRHALLDLRAARTHPLSYAGLLLLKLVDLAGLATGAASARMRRAT